MKKTWTVHARETLYSGFFKALNIRFSHSLFAGGESPVITREVQLRGEAAAVLIWDPARDTFLMIEQIRAGALNEANGPWLTEIVAGMLGEGEEPEQVVRREALEEANVELLDVVPMLRYLPSPGGTDEGLHLFLAKAELEHAGGVFGLAEEGEDIRAFTVPTAEALAMLERGDIHNSMTVIALQWWQLHHAELDWR